MSLALSWEGRVFWELIRARTFELAKLQSNKWATKNNSTNYHWLKWGHLASAPSWLFSFKHAMSLCSIRQMRKRLLMQNLRQWTLTSRRCYLKWCSCFVQKVNTSVSEILCLHFENPIFNLGKKSPQSRNKPLMNFCKVPLLISREGTLDSSQAMTKLSSLAWLRASCNSESPREEGNETRE